MDNRHIPHSPQNHLNHHSLQLGCWMAHQRPPYVTRSQLVWRHCKRDRSCDCARHFPQAARRRKPLCPGFWWCVELVMCPEHFTHTLTLRIHEQSTILLIRERSQRRSRNRAVWHIDHLPGPACHPASIPTRCLDVCCHFCRVNDHRRGVCTAGVACHKV